jgi:hypothetical protein
VVVPGASRPSTDKLFRPWRLCDSRLDQSSRNGGSLRHGCGVPSLPDHKIYPPLRNSSCPLWLFPGYIPRYQSMLESVLSMLATFHTQYSIILDHLCQHAGYGVILERRQGSPCSLRCPFRPPDHVCRTAQPLKVSHRRPFRVLHQSLTPYVLSFTYSVQGNRTRGTYSRAEIPCITFQ